MHDLDQLLGGLLPGDNVVWVTSSRGVVVAIERSFLAEGLRRGEQCLYVTTEIPPTKLRAGIGDVAVSDSKGLIYHGRDGLNPVKAALAAQTNKAGLTGSTESALHGADVFIGLSSGKVPEQPPRPRRQPPRGDRQGHPVRP